MTAKEYLNQFREDHREISRLKQEIEDLCEALDVQAVRYTGISVKGGRKYDDAHFAEVIASIEALKQSYFEKVEDVYKQRKQAIDLLKGIRDNRFADILYWRYMQGLSWDEVSEKTFISQRWMMKLHPEALKAFERKYKNLLN